MRREGHYTIKEVDRLPKRLNRNFWYTIRGENYSRFFRHDDVLQIKEFTLGGGATNVPTITGVSIDDTDPLNLVILPQTAAQTETADIEGNFIATTVEGVLAELQSNIEGITPISITSIDVRPTTNVNEFTVELTWVDSDNRKYRWRYYSF